MMSSHLKVGIHTNPSEYMKRIALRLIDSKNRYYAKKGTLRAAASIGIGGGGSVGAVVGDETNRNAKLNKGLNSYDNDDEDGQIEMLKSINRRITVIFPLTHRKYHLLRSVWKDLYKDLKDNLPNILMDLGPSGFYLQLYNLKDKKERKLAFEICQERLGILCTKNEILRLMQLRKERGDIKHKV